MAWVHLEPVMLVLRAANEGTGFGDAYDFAASVIVRGDRAEIIGGAGRFNPAWREEIDRQLGLLGVREIVIERRGRRRVLRLRSPA